MKLTDAIKGYILDAKIEPQTPKHIALKEQRLGVFRSWCEAQGVLDVNEVTPMILKTYTVHLQGVTIGEDDHRYSFRGRKFSPRTVSDYMKAVRAFFAWCEREGYLNGTDPTRRVPHVKLPKHIIPTFSSEQMQRMLDTLDQTTTLGYRDFTILLVLMDTGIRVGELCGLKLSNVHEDYLKVFGKGSKEREVGLGPTASRSLWKYIHHFRKPIREDDEHVFLSRAGRPLLRSDVWSVLKYAGKQAGITDVRCSPHTLRHSFAKSWLSNGGDVFKLSRVLGHTEVQTTQTYLKDFQSREARQDHSRFSPVETNRLGRRISKKKANDKGAK